MEQDPFQGDIKRLKGQSTAWHRRVGNYRIVYDLYFEQRLIVVAGIIRRTSTTYRNETAFVRRGFSRRP